MLQLRDIVREVQRMQPGQQLDLSRDAAFDLINGHRPPLGFNYTRKPDPSEIIGSLVLEKVVGSAYEYGCYIANEGQYIRFYRRSEPLPDTTEARTFVSLDRLHLFTRDGYGLYHRNEVPR